MRALGTIRWNMTEDLDSMVALPLGGAVLVSDTVALCSETCLGVVSSYVSALGQILCHNHSHS
jgi:hypothetical protein